MTNPGRFIDKQPEKHIFDLQTPIQMKHVIFEKVPDLLGPN